MPSNSQKEKKKNENESTIKDKVVSILFSIVYFIFFILSGIFLCFFKLIFSNVGNINTFRFDDFVNEFAPNYPQVAKSSWTFFPSSSSNEENMTNKINLSNTGLSKEQQLNVKKQLASQQIKPGETIVIDVNDVNNSDRFPNIIQDDKKNKQLDLNNQVPSVPTIIRAKKINDDNVPERPTVIPNTSSRFTGGQRLRTNDAKDPENITIPTMWTRAYIPKQKHEFANKEQQQQQDENKSTKEEKEKMQDDKTVYCKQIIINVQKAVKKYFDALCLTNNSYFNKVYLDISIMMMYLLYHFSKFLNMFFDSMILCGFGWITFFFFIFLLCPIFVGIFFLISLFRHSLLYGILFLFTGIVSITFPFLYIFILIQSFRLLMPVSTGGQNEDKMAMFELDVPISINETNNNSVELLDQNIFSYSLSSFFHDFFQTNQTIPFLCFLFVFYTAYTKISSMFGNVILVLFLLYYFFYVKRNLSIFTKDQLLARHWTTITQAMIIINN